MKIRKIWLQNINSLRSNSLICIDLSGDPYQDAGLFTITGPTGSGKSSILDAICLSLYGRTPRFDSNEKSAQHIMSFGSVEAMTRVEYQIGSEIFQSTWSVTRARKKIDGKIQDPDMQVVSIIPTIKTLSTKIRESIAINEGLIGLKFEHFKKAVLLAQGDFTAFLKGSQDERKEILERLTNSSHYQEISIYTYRKNSEIQRIFGETQKEQQQILEEIATYGDKEFLYKEHQRLEAFIYESNKVRSDLENSLGMFRTLEDMIAQKDAVLAKVDYWTSSQGQFNSVSELIKNHEYFSPHAKLAEAYTTQETELLRLRKEENTLNQEVKHLELGLLENATKLENQQIQVESDLMWKIQQETLVGHLEIVIRDIEIHEKAIQDQRKIHGDIQSKLQREKKVLENEHHNYKELINKLQELETTVSFTPFKDHNLELLTNEKNILLQQIQDVDGSIDSKQGSFNALISDIQLLSKLEQMVIQVEEIQNQLKTITEEVINKTTENTQLLDLITEVSRKYQERKNLLEKLETLLGIARYRNFLEPNKPCPLCGSLEHPDGTKPVEPNLKDELASEINEIDSTLKSIISKSQELTISIQRMEKEIEGLSNHNHKLKVKIIEFSQANKLEIPTDSMSLSDVIKIINIKQEKKTYIEKLLLEDQDRRKWLNMELLRLDEIIKLKYEQDNLRESAKNLGLLHKKQESVVETLTQDLNNSLQKGNEIKKELEDLNTKLKLDGQGKTIFQIKQEINNRIDHSQMVLNQIKNTIKNEELSLMNRKTHMAIVQEAIITGTRANNTIVETLAKQNMTPKMVLDNLLDEEQYNTNKQILHDNHLEGLQLKTRLDEINHSIELLEEKLRALQGKNEVENRLHLLETQLSQGMEQLVSIKEQLSTLKTLEARHAQLLSTQTKIEQDAVLWGRLNQLIGSANGHNFSRFAQGLNLKILLKSANKYLMSLHPRYLLKQSPHDLLEFDLEDTWQGSHIRTTRNLSGGESFLVSLSLALGLAELASKKVKIESLFIDEGFGTLDAASLDKAISALERLAFSGKLVGIISHVDTIRERINLGIRIKKLPDGSGLIEQTLR